MSTFLVPRSIRAKIVCLLMVPVVSLMALWAFATVTTARSASELSQCKEANSTLLKPLDVARRRRAGRTLRRNLRQLAAPSRERADNAADEREEHRRGRRRAPPRNPGAAAWTARPWATTPRVASPN